MDAHVCGTFCLVDQCPCGPWDGATEEEAYRARHSEVWHEIWKNTPEGGKWQDGWAPIWKRIQEERTREA
jgi:hypothetical protein